MSEFSASTLRKANAAKAKRLTATDPHQKVDASSWTPPEPLNTTAKTGARPVSRRAYKRGGKVKGDRPALNAGRKQRADGGRSVDDFVNRDVKAANAKLGKPHVGGWNKGGRAEKGRSKKAIGGIEILNPVSAIGKRLAPDNMKGSIDPVGDKLGGILPFKKGGRTKKAFGGEMTDPRQAAADRIAGANNRAGVAPARMQFDRQTATKLPGMKRGGRSAKADGGTIEKEKKAVDKLLKSASGKATGGEIEKGPVGSRIFDQDNKDTTKYVGKGRSPGKVMPDAIDEQLFDAKRADIQNRRYGQYKNDKARREKEDAAKKPKKRFGLFQAGGRVDPPPRPSSADRTEAKAILANPQGQSKQDSDYAREVMSRTPKKSGGSAGNYTGGTRPTGGRIARKAGGRTKGKTTININVNAGGKGNDMPIPGMTAPIKPPVPVPPISAAPPMPGPGPAGGMLPAPPMAPPGALPRRDGGRVRSGNRKGYTNMAAGAGGGLGRLEKAAKQRNGR